MSTVQELEDKWAVMMAARDPRTGERIAERDRKYARECFDLRVQIEEMKAGDAQQAQQVELSPTQVSQLEWLDRVQGAKDSSGKRLMDDHGLRGQEFRKKVFTAQHKLWGGRTLTQEEIDSTMHDVHAQHLTLPDVVHSPKPGGGLPPATFNSRALTISQGAN